MAGLGENPSIQPRRDEADDLLEDRRLVDALCRPISMALERIFDDPHGNDEENQNSLLPPAGF